MAYIYDTDILAALWTGGEDGNEPYAQFIIDNPTLTDEPSENRILSTIEAIRSHMEVLADRDEARLFHFCVATMLEGFGSGGFIYGATSGNENTVVEGNMPNPTFAAGDIIDIRELDGVTVGAVIGAVTATGGDLVSFIADFNTAALVDAAGGTITASRTQDGRLRITQGVGTAPATRASGFVITRGVAANDNAVTTAGIVTQEPGARATNPVAGGGGYYLPRVTAVANEASDRALRVFQGQIRAAGLNT
jgi:hypothetical protein